MKATRMLQTDTMEAPAGTVMALSAGRATVRVEDAAVCPRCAAGRGCGAAVFTTATSGRLIDLAVPPGRELRVGERVHLSLEPTRLLQAAWLAYGVPLAAMIVAALGAGWLLPASAHDGLVVVAAAAGLALGAWWARRQLARSDCLNHFVPALRQTGEALRSRSREQGRD